MSHQVSMECKEVAQKVWGLDISMRLAREAATFYTLLLMELDCPSPQVTQLLNAKTDYLVDQFTKYIPMICGGELRHYNSSERGKVIHPLGTEYFSRHDYSTYTLRNIGWASWKDFVNDNSLLPSMELAKKIFRVCFPPNTSFGGEKWAAIAHTLIMFLTGQTTPRTFVDTAFGLEHCSRTMFDKLWDTKSLITILDANLEDDMYRVIQSAEPKIRYLARKRMPVYSTENRVEYYYNYRKDKKPRRNPFP